MFHKEHEVNAYSSHRVSSCTRFISKQLKTISTKFAVVGGEAWGKEAIGETKT